MNAGVAAGAADDPSYWREAFTNVRAETERRAALLSAEDQVVQSMPDASPAKWHRAHVTWFFEEFLLRKFAHAYRPFDERFAYLFNSYYVSAGPRHARPQRGLITRPGAEEVTAYRAYVDQAVTALVESTNNLAAIAPIIEIGLNHEQQHQELLLTDILHAFSLNATYPAYDPRWQWPQCAKTTSGAGARLAGVCRIGHEGQGFCFDNEQPRHEVLLQPVRLLPSLVTNAQWLEFMADGGYTTPTLWLSDGWATAEAQAWNAPGYWQNIDGVWFSMTLGGLRPIEAKMPVCHVSYYEADAFARWAGKVLPTEAEWEVAAQNGGALDDAFGVVWQWTRSAYAPYPGYRAAPGALGEYNGKFMINQMVLRGSSLATPAAHSRPTYRNFFYPSARWQFSGLRLAEYER
ncbi:MAG TPA: ergothioneine biosynthesis protein EgtB [Xanthobacteraceae bacterium]|nr:ergothioneine biosynthesis protein EgtB [Xanthobacteraceae bacterium]